MLEVNNIYKTYEGQPLLNGVSFTISAGETVCLLGASGSGKSTILRIIAGLEKAESGDIRWQGRSLLGVPVHQRNFGLMFQDYALFPHLDVFENIAFGLRMHKWPLDKINLRVSEVLIQANLSAFARRSVAELSGGEQQRVALARALAPNPALLMLDEPLGALDRALREKLVEELRTILRLSGIPALYVTHDQEEAFTVADKIILLHEGLVVQAGPPLEVFAKPATAWVASFLGLGNVLTGVITSSGVLTSFGEIFWKTGLEPGQNVTFLLRPQARIVDTDGMLSGRVMDVVFRGTEFRVELENGLYFLLPTAPHVGDTISLQVFKGQLL